MPRLSDIQTFNSTIVPRDGKIHEHVLFLLILCRCCTSKVQLYRLPFYTHLEFLTQWWSFPVLSWKLILLVCHSTPVVVWIRSRRIAKPCETQYWPTMLWWYWAFVLIVRKWHSRTCRSVLDIEQPKVTLSGQSRDLYCLASYQSISWTIALSTAESVWGVERYERPILIRIHTALRNRSPSMSTATSRLTSRPPRCSCTFCLCSYYHLLPSHLRRTR